ncbi:MAG: class II fructose-bisphosphate aldolase [Anaerolineae bacterium]|nr:class II fructose-bisphosphate aldolase [Anaerolineae bacterium]
MPLVSSRELLERARKGRYAVGAFNADNMEMLQAIVEVAEEERAPVIVQVSEPTIRYAGLSMPAGMVRIAATAARVPVVLHLDHGTGLEQNVHALQAGFTSLMFDGSRLPYEENVAITRSVVRAARAASVPVEAELGRVLNNGATPREVAAAMTDPRQAADFVARTGCDSLAVAAGSVHAMTGSSAELDVDRLRAISRRVGIPLVLHGASGVTDASVLEAMAAGVCKVNVATYLKQGFVESLRAAMAAHPDEVDFRRLFAPAREAVKERLRVKMRLFGASGRANG